MLSSVFHARIYNNGGFVYLFQHHRCAMFLMTLLKYILYFAIFIVGKSRYAVFVDKISH